MNPRKTLAYVLGGIGTIAFFALLFKMMVIGYYTSELPLLGLGAAVMFGLLIAAMQLNKHADGPPANLERFTTISRSAPAADSERRDDSAPGGMTEE